MNIKFAHMSSRQEAVARVKNALNEARPKLGDKATINEERWDGDMLHFAFTAQGQHISGQLEVRDHEFDINITLPLMLQLFEGQIKKMIEEQAKQMLG